MVHWLRWYKSILEMLPTERPDNKVIADDVALDKWWDKYVRDAVAKMGGSQPVNANMFGMTKDEIMPSFEG